MIFFQHSSKFFSKNSAFSIIHTEKGTSLHWHRAIEFMYVVNGEIKVSLNGTEYVAKNGDLVTINSSVVHSAMPTNKDIDYYILIANDEFFKSNGLVNESTFFSPLVNSNEITNIFTEIIKEYESKDDFKDASITALSLSLFIHLNRHHTENKNVSENIYSKKITAVRDTIDYINTNYKNKLSIDEIANNMHFSKSYLSHVFKNVTGYSIVDYINVIRCQNARMLILDGLSIKEASFECGFLDVSYFTRIFKKTMGILPSNVK